MKSSEALDVQYNEAELLKLTPQRLKALKTACYRLTSVFYCEACREYHVDMMEPEEKQRFDQLRNNLGLISKVQNIKGSLV
jgi:hypothetical protein